MEQKQENVDQLVIVHQYVEEWLTNGPIHITGIIRLITEYIYEFYGTLIQTLSHSSYVCHMALTPQGNLVTDSADHQIYVWDTQSGTCLLRLPHNNVSIKHMTCLPDGKLATTSYYDTHGLNIWDTASHIPPEPCTEPYAQPYAEPIHNPGTIVVLSDHMIATSSTHHNTIKVWDGVSGKLIHALVHHIDNVLTLITLPSSIGLPVSRLASGSCDNTIKVWDTLKGVLILTLSGHTGQVNDLANLSDGKLASASHDKTVRVWDTEKGELIYTLSGHTGYVSILAVLPCGKLASGSDDLMIKLWDAVSGTLIHTLQGHTGGLSCMGVLPCGKLVTGSMGQQRQMCVWDTVSGTLILTFLAVRDREWGFHELVVLPCGKLATKYNKKVQIWG